MGERRGKLALAGLIALLGFSDGPGQAAAETFTATPANYLSFLDKLKPGDRLMLQAGSYRRGMILKGLHGEPGKAIVITGPPNRSAVFLGRPGSNTIELRDVSHLEIGSLTLDGRNTPRVDAVKAQDVTHHVTLENLEIINYGTHQQTVGISTKAPAWNWVIRNNVIRGAGTGLYLGNSDGTAPFVQGVIEHNLIVGSIGYGLQIKHQKARPGIAGMPSGPGSTIIRYNIISKASQPKRGFQGPRPNLLVGHFPPSGLGAEDVYEIYGNLLNQNLVDEPLFQGEGNIAFHDNLLVNDHGDGIWIQPHNDRPRKIAVFHNTVLARGRGISITMADPRFEQRVVGNAIFAQMPIQSPDRSDNVIDRFDAAGKHLKNPLDDWATRDLRPQPGALLGPPIDLAPFADFLDIDKDFAGSPRKGTARGAYAGDNVDAGDFSGLQLDF